MIYKYILIFLGAGIPWIEVPIVVPFGIIIGLSPFWVMFWALIGNLTTVYILIFGFEKIKKIYDKRSKKDKAPLSNRSKRARESLQKYGLPGLTLLGPILTGTHIAAFIGLLLNAKKKQMVIWQTISIVVWVLTFGIVTLLGFNFFDLLRQSF